MNQVLALSVVFMLSAIVTCNQTESGIEPPPSMEVSLSYIDEDSADVLDPNTLRFFNIYYLQLNDDTGELERDSVRSPQYSFYQNQFTNLLALRLFPNREFVDGQSTTLIESPRDDFDTLTVEGRKEGRGAVAETIWYNGEKVWKTSADPPPRYFIITKESGSF